MIIHIPSQFPLRFYSLYNHTTHCLQSADAEEETSRITILPAPLLPNNKTYFVSVQAKQRPIPFTRPMGRHNPVTSTNERRLHLNLVTRIPSRLTPVHSRADSIDSRCREKCFDAIMMCHPPCRSPEPAEQAARGDMGRKALRWARVGKHQGIPAPTSKKTYTTVIYRCQSLTIGFLLTKCGLIKRHQGGRFMGDTCGKYKMPALSKVM